MEHKYVVSVLQCLMSLGADLGLAGPATAMKEHAGQAGSFSLQEALSTDADLLRGRGTC